MTDGLDEKVKEAAKDGRLPCARAFKIAKEEGVSAGEIGKVANRLNIKITNCQLGCF